MIRLRFERKIRPQTYLQQVFMTDFCEHQDVCDSAMGEKSASSGPPLCVQILSTVALVCFGLYCIAKGVSFGFFNWWYILGAASLVATGFAAFRVYEVFVILAQREKAEADLCRRTP
ncbi:hypothetical protein PHYPO_G00158140 [Pangasianodon hypophthalmus]|uniref:Uncharacterized protein n=1 Tax=Pangasianodon hypophthalmus TaxID=310915 RepID=A0A5N5JXK3_PANHP|nr:hypothetical protein PHYPO_G00158140 [Pangasianodon hypophthalmus]